MAVVTLSNRDSSLDQTALYFDRVAVVTALAAVTSGSSDEYVVEDFRNFTVALSGAGTVTTYAQLVADGAWFEADVAIIGTDAPLRQTAGPFYALKLVVSGGPATAVLRCQR